MKGAHTTMAGPTDVIIAGTKPFALALFAPVTERAGTRPRIAPEPAAAMTLCAEACGLLVVEYDAHWLPAITQLRLRRPGLRVVAALSPGQEGAALELGPLKVESVRWDGKALSVMPAIERALAGSRPPPVAEPPVLDLVGDLGGRAEIPFPASLETVAAPAATTAPVLDLFRDLGASGATPAPASLERLSAMSVPGPDGPAAWPANGPSAVEAEQLLRGALDGDLDPSALGALARQVAAGLSELEREVFKGGTPAVDPAPLRRVAVLRLRVAAALATRPPHGTASDSGAVAELLSELDELLQAVKGLIDGASPELKLQLEPIRNALVREAVDFSEACHEVGTAELPLIPAAEASRPTGRAATAKVLSVHAGVDEEDRPEEQRRRVMPLVTLAVLLLLGAGYHAWNYFATPPRQEVPTFEGAPPGTMAVQNGKANFMVQLPGHKVNAADLETFMQREAKHGNRVREVGPGTWIIEPATAGARP
jgi:hypothetical protein